MDRMTEYMYASDSVCAVKSDLLFLKDFIPLCVLFILKPRKTWAINAEISASLPATSPCE